MMSTPTPEFLRKFRSETDELADAVIGKIIADGETREVNSFYRSMMKNTTLPPDEMPAFVREYFIETAKMPDFADNRLIKAGQDCFKKYGPEISMMLLCKSLPASYACANGAEVLYRTGRLNEKSGNLHPFTRRLMETSQFTINVLCEGGLSPEGTGIRTAQKVRLMHASIRHFIRQTGDWDAQVLGEPINQEDMAGTLMDFAVYPLEGMEQIGMDLSDEEKEGYYHVWRIIGHVMGVNPALIPPNFAEGSILGHAILDHQKRASEAGRELTTACIDFLERITPGTLFDFYPQILVRYLIGNELADMTGVRDFPDSLEHLLEKLTIGIFGRVDKALDRNGIISRLAKRFNIKLLEGMVNYFNNDKQINFFIPPSLQENWFPKEREESWNNLAASPDIAGYRLALQKRTKF